MALIIVVILLLSNLLIITEKWTRVNKAAVAIFAGTVGWVLYICYGTDFVMSQHSHDYESFLGGLLPSASLVKQYICQNIFIVYVGKASSVVLFLLSTMTIVEILNNNGCFDFISVWIRTRKSRKFLWLLAIVTFVISANLDNLTTTVMMLTIMREIVANRRQRMIYGSAVVLAANCGGALTVIGDPTGLVLWNMGAVSATNFSLSLALPCLVAWIVPTLWIGFMLPDHVDFNRVYLRYRGDDTNLNVTQRIIMLFVGIGGLWFIPTFHNITKLPPFLGALCVLSILWIVNEIFNRKLMNADQMTKQSVPRVLQYGVIQMMLFVMGIMLAAGVVKETGAFNMLAGFLDTNLHNVWIIGALSGLVSTLLDNFATAMQFISFHDVVSGISLSGSADMGYMQAFAENGIFWKLVAYSTAICGSVFAFGSMSGLAFMKMERIHLGWYFRNVGWKVVAGWLLGLAAMWILNI
jgi:Na+/H+ antiporter NhaD/arsenite permease-like protein